MNIIEWTDFLWNSKRLRQLYPSFWSNWKKKEVDFGSAAPKTDATFTITDSDCTATSKVIVTSSGDAATGRAAGDDLWDAITYSAVPASGSFTVYAYANPGPVVGKRNILYSIS